MSPLMTSMLFVPGGDGRKLAKIPDLTAPALIIDLEDAVAEQRKEAARAAVAAVLAAPLTSVPLWVRINADRPGACQADLRAVFSPHLAGVLLPKAESARDVEAVDWYLTGLEQQAGLPVGTVRIMPIIESVTGLEAAADIARAGSRVECLVLGAGDFSLDVGLDWPARNGVSALVLHAKERLVLVSRAAGIAAPHDGTYPMFRDAEGLRREAEQARDLGMFGKHAVHPDQIPVIDAVFTPTDEQIGRARRIVEEFDASERLGVGNVVIGGQFVDYPVAHRARALLETARALAPAVGRD
ncbi:citrate lyase [Streptomyces sulfonofaciens]|uniref:Citrate lyase n=1 Tax=Streptomyces sulfonofaciens TaxID=68272 RepID=A0A919G7W8_9ACTN|nr:CoA ester lyase [Streptomyces sulfonofaciens]GHH79379.1 citrate lyase [Streptomyces sulfonofaciens]